MKSSLKMMMNNFLNLTKRILSLESNNCQNPIPNNDAFSDFNDQHARSKNIIIFNAQESTDNTINNSDITTVNCVIEKLGFDVKPISIIYLGKPNNKARLLQIVLNTTSFTSFLK